MYIVRLSENERVTLEKTLKKLKGSYSKIRRCQILLKACANGLHWTDKKIAEAFDCRIKTVENIRKRFVTEGFDVALNGKKRAHPSRQKKLSGEEEAKVIAMRLGPAPKGYSNWSLRLLADRCIELGIVESISHETIRQTLKKTV